MFLIFDNMQFLLYNNELINLYLQLKNDDTFALVSKDGKEYLSLKKGDLGQLEFSYDPILFSESEESVTSKIDDLYHQYVCSWYMLDL